MSVGSVHRLVVLVVAVSGPLSMSLVPVGAQGDSAQGPSLKNPVVATRASIEAGSRDFRRACGSCHGLDAKGTQVLSENPDPGPDPPDLTDDVWVYGSDEGDIFLNIKNGIGPRMYMDKWGDQLTDEQIWNIINYLRSLRSSPRQR